MIAAVLNPVRDDDDDDGALLAVPDFEEDTKALDGVSGLVAVFDDDFVCWFGRLDDELLEKKYNRASCTNLASFSITRRISSLVLFCRSLLRASRRFC